jgi:hypothetical protein
MENLEEKEATFLTEKEIQQVINSLSDDIIFDSVKEQIQNVFTSVDTTPTFYITYFTTKYDFIMSKYSEYEEVVTKVKEIREELFMKIKGLLEERFDFTLEFPDSIEMKERFNIISHLYGFLVVRNKDNSTRIVINNIEREMKDLIKHYKPLIDKKDLTYLNMKKFINKDITTIICKLPEIISNIEVATPKDLIELAIEDEWELTNLVVKDVLSEERNMVSFGSNFVQNFLKPIKENETFYLLARTYFINKYNEKK